MKTVIIGLSGGMDSATLLGMLLQQGLEVHCLQFAYGSKHEAYEGKAAHDIVRFYKREHKMPVTIQTVGLANIFMPINSALLRQGEAIPEGHYNDETMQKTIVPGRNLIMASILAATAESMGADFIALGVHQGDHFIYPDCRPGFINLLRLCIDASSDKKVHVLAPLLEKNKTDILRIGLALPIQVPYQLTRTCYKNQEDSCGKCGSCVERLEAFSNLNIKDPIVYEQNKNNLGRGF